MSVTIFGSGSLLIGVAYTETSTKTTTTATIPADNTIPQITEGVEIMALSYTPKLSTSYLYVTVTACVNNASNVPQTVAVFRDSTANAVASACGVSYGRSGVITFSFRIPSNSTAATTLYVRHGASSGSSYLNQTDTSTFAAGVVSSIMIKEIG